jgi:hypothetical protein
MIKAETVFETLYFNGKEEPLQIRITAEYIAIDLVVADRNNRRSHCYRRSGGR